MLLDRVIADAADRGAQWIEGYPHNVPDGDAGHFRGPSTSTMREDSNQSNSASTTRSCAAL
jgi:hypothetical protein